MGERLLPSVPHIPLDEHRHEQYFLQFERHVWPALPAVPSASILVRSSTPGNCGMLTLKPAPEPACEALDHIAGCVRWKPKLTQELTDLDRCPGSANVNDTSALQSGGWNDETRAFETFEVDIDSPEAFVGASSALDHAKADNLVFFKHADRPTAFSVFKFKDTLELLGHQYDLEDLNTRIRLGLTEQLTWTEVVQSYQNLSSSLPDELKRQFSIEWLLDNGSAPC